MDIDEIFKRPPLPKGSTKRKFQFNESVASTETTKSSKLDSVLTSSSSVPVSSKGKGKATVPNGIDEGAEATGLDTDDDGGDFAPGGDADYFTEEDEDGRFFGGGLNDVQKKVLNIMDHDVNKGADIAAGDMSSSGVRKHLLGLDKAIKVNREMRTRHGDDPEKFVDSEFTLLETLRALLLLSSVPSTSYPQIIQQSTLPRLADLLLHENSDVIIAVIELLEDWVDEEVLEVDDDEGDDDEEEGTTGIESVAEDERRREAMRNLVDGLMNANIVELIAGGIQKFNEDDEAERGGVFHSLSLIESLVTLSPLTALPLLSPASDFLPYLTRRFSRPTPPSAPEMDQNRFYAAELFSILIGLSAGDETVDQAILVARERMVQAEDVVEKLLKTVSVYRRRDPSGADELEFMENLFDSICTLIGSPGTKQKFILGEGTELMCIALSAKTRLSRTRAAKVLDYAMQGKGEGSRLISEKFVDRLGLKSLFSLFMGKSGIVDRKSNATGGTTKEDLEHILSIISSLFTNLPSESPHRLRLLAKFVENEYEKVDRLFEMRVEIEVRVNTRSEFEVQGDDFEVDEEEEYFTKLEKGLFSLQLVDYIVGWLCMEDDGIRDHIKMLLERKGDTLESVIKVLIEYRRNAGSNLTKDTLDYRNESSNGEADKDRNEIEDEEVEQAEILDHLIVYLQSLL